MHTTTNRMSDPMDQMNKSFDVEAQQSLLHVAETEVIDAEQVVDEADEKERDSSARRALQTIILVIRSTQLFKLGANHYSDDDVTSSISSTSTNCNYTSCNSPHDHGSGIVPDLENSAESAQDTLSTANSAPQHGEHDNEQRVPTENIAEIVKIKNLHDLNNRLGGIEGVAKALNSDLCNGLSIPQTNTYHHNSTQLPSQYLITFYHSFLGACKNFTILLLVFAAILSLTFGIMEQGLNKNGCFDGTVVILTILVLVIFATVKIFLKEMRSQRELENSWQSKGGKIEVLVVRGGDYFFVSVIDLRVGDVVILRKGDQVPADGVGVSVDGQALELDDSTTIKPTIIDENNPFLFYGSRVIGGNGRMIVTTMGMDTVWREMMSGAIQSTDKKCTVEACLHKLNSCIQNVGISTSILIIILLFLRYKQGKLDDENGYKTDNKGEPTQVNAILDVIKGILTPSKRTARVFINLLSISLLGVMEGLPFVISVAIIIWNRKTLAGKASEKDYLACVKMASVTTICTDKFGGLTEHEKVIDRFFVGEELVRESSVVASDVLEGICDGIGSLSLLPSSECESKVLPLVSWAETKLGMKKGSCKMISSKGSNPYQELCRVLIEKTGNEGQKKYLLHLIGPPQDILAMCLEYYDIKGIVQTIDADNDDKKTMFDQVTRHVSSEAEVIGYACKCVNENDVASIEDDSRSFTFLGMVGLKDAKMEDTKRAISTLKEGGIRIILTSGDDVSILKTIGQNCGLLVSDSDDLVLTGEEFRCDEERMDKLDKICIIGNCLPSDKILLIKCLKEKGKVVALLGQKTIDAPALRLADIGLTFGTWSSEVARESSDISFWDGDFNFLINVIENGRCFHENIRKFIQLELIIAISSSLINFTATLVLGDAPLTVIKLFWLNLVVALFGGLALLTGPSTKSLMTMLPVSYSSGKLITKAMWRNIAIQASYQTTILVTLQHKGNAILGVGESKVKSMVYNGFFLCQIVNKFIARMPEKKNIFGGLFQENRRFLVALVLLLMCQAVFAVTEQVLGNNPGLNWELWGVCLSIGLICWLLDMAGKTAYNFINFLANLCISEN